MVTKRAREVAADADSEAIVAPGKRPKVNIMAMAVSKDGESAESLRKRVQESAGQVCGIVASIPELLARISKARARAASARDGTEDSAGPLVSAEVDDAKRAIALLAMGLKHQARKAASCTDGLHTQLLKSKDALNKHDLNLQSLQYEQRHILEQLTHCKDFRSKHEEIALEPVEVFLSKAPTDLSRNVEDDPHKLFLNRIAYETSERTRLSELLTRAEAKNEAIKEKILEDEKYLSSVRSKLEAILDYTKPLQKSITRDVAIGNTSNERARFLPPPLYALYFSAIGYCDGVDKDCAVEIVGDIDVAKAHFARQSKESTETSIPVPKTPLSKRSSSRHARTEDAMQVDNDKEDDEAEQAEAARQQLLALDPLSVVLKIIVAADKEETATKGNGKPFVLLRFSYVTQLGIITVKDSVQHLDLSVCGADLCANLYPGDDGAAPPNPSNSYQLDKCGVNSLVDYRESLGIAFHWCQWLGGLDFLQQGCGEMRRYYIDQVIGFIRSRVAARHALVGQLDSLDRLKVRCPNGESVDDRFPVRPVTKLTGWGRKEKSDGMFTTYKAVVNHSDKERDVTVEAQVTVDCEYPVRQPLFALNVTEHSDSSVLTNMTLRNVEIELNIHAGEMFDGSDGVTPYSTEFFLMAQMRRLLTCIDMCLEAEASSSTNPFQKGRLFLRPSKGRDRAPPLQCDVEKGRFTNRA